MEPNKTNPSALKAIIAVVVVALGGLGLWKLSTTSSDEVVPVQQPSTTDASASAPTDESAGSGNTGATSTTPTTSATSGKYKDGTYSAVGNYNSPEGGEQVSISVTLKDGVVTNSTFTGHSDSGRSQSYMNRFSAGFTTLVVSKPIDQISLSVVNGSSLTPIGFMNALSKIKAEAKA